MNFRLLLCIGMGVFVAHLGVFMVLSHLRPQPRMKLPAQNFKVRSQVVVDHDTGEKTVYREITVSTRLATPAPTSMPGPELVAMEKRPLIEAHTAKTFSGEKPMHPDGQRAND